MNRKIQTTGCLLCALAIVFIFSVTPASARGGNDNDDGTGGALPEPVAKQAIIAVTGTAEWVVTGKKFTLRRGAEIIVNGLYGDRYVIRYGKKICLFPADSILIKPSQPAGSELTDDAALDAEPTVWPTLEDVLRSSAVAELRKHLGKRYVWSATGPGKFDCSGLTRYVYLIALGYEMPRTSYHQQNIDSAITLQQAKPGDLLFFKYGTRGNRYGVNHTGMYIGNMQMIDANGRVGRILTETLQKGDSHVWPVKVVSPIRVIMLRYPTIKTTQENAPEQTLQPSPIAPEASPSLPYGFPSSP